MKLRAYAKINLGLDVLGKRADGYHEVKMIMQMIQMYDLLDIEKTKQPGIHLTTNLSYIPVNENNLVYKAAQLLMERFDVRDGVTINLHKFIPVAAGMAGGSSDAAAALVGSSAKRRDGCRIMAIIIPTRWFIPPDRKQIKSRLTALVVHPQSRPPEIIPEAKIILQGRLIREQDLAIQAEIQVRKHLDRRLQTML